MTPALVERLRDPRFKGQEFMRREAADRIEALEAALKEIASNQRRGGGPNDAWGEAIWRMDRARTALSEPKHE